MKISASLRKIPITFYVVDDHVTEDQKVYIINQSPNKSLAPDTNKGTVVLLFLVSRAKKNQTKKKRKKNIEKKEKNKKYTRTSNKSTKTD